MNFRRSMTHRKFLDCGFSFVRDIRTEMDANKCVGCYVKNKYEEMEVELWKAKKNLAESKEEADQLRMEVELLRIKLKIQNERSSNV